MSTDAHRIVEQSIRRLRNIKFASTGIFIPCPFHSNDTEPSLGVNLGKSGIPIGYFSCFGCGAKGPWNVLAEKLGFPKLSTEHFKTTETLKYDFVEIRRKLLAQSSVERMLSDLEANFTMDWPEEDNWRAINGNLLHSIGALITYDGYNKDRAILLPVNVRGNTVGMVKGTNQRRDRSYILNPGQWAKSFGLFPFDYSIALAEKTGNSIALVEGPRDALRLLKFNLPAIAILGSQSWSETKRNTLLGMGLRRIVLAFDGDRAGIQCTNKVWNDLKTLIPTSVLKLAPHSEALGTKVDPGNMGKDLLRELRDKLRII